MNAVESYLAKLSEKDRKELSRIRNLIKKLVPQATEGIGYGMPVFKVDGKYLLGYAAFKDHLSIFPGGEAVGVFAKELEGYKTSKGTIQFTSKKNINDKLLSEIVIFCLGRLKKG